MQTETSSSVPRRAVVLFERAPSDVARALSAAGLEVRSSSDPLAQDVLLIDPRCLGEGAVEVLIAARAGALLARTGDAVPELHQTVMSQAERGLIRAVLAHTNNHLGRASKILGVDRNTCARKARAFGLVDEPSRGRKPAAKPGGRGKSLARSRSRGKRTR
jgi:DNA-binding NtrC family response regulator